MCWDTPDPFAVPNRGPCPHCGSRAMSGWIIVAEPSPFRRDETRVSGPYRWRWWAIFIAWASVPPYGESRVVSAKATVMLGARQLWPRVAR